MTLVPPMNDYDHDVEGEDDDGWHGDDDREWGETSPCPECGADIFDDAVQCPQCGWYVTWETASGRSARWDGIVRAGMTLIGIGIVSYALLWWMLSR